MGSEVRQRGLCCISDDDAISYETFTEWQTEDRRVTFITYTENLDSEGWKRGRKESLQVIILWETRLTAWLTQPQKKKKKEGKRSGSDVCVQFFFFYPAFTHIILSKKWELLSGIADHWHVFFFYICVISLNSGEVIHRILAVSEGSPMLSTPLLCTK